MRKLTHLERQPVIDMGFELRFTPTTQVSEIMLGLLYHVLGAQGQIDSLPPAEIPREIRRQDENLHYAVLNRFLWNDHYVGISDHGIVLSSAREYQGWSKSKQALLELIQHLKNYGLLQNLIRYSIKYVDLFEGQHEENLLKKLNFSLKFANAEVSNQAFSLRMERNIDQHINIINIIGHAMVEAPDRGLKKEGLILDIDSIRLIDANLGLSATEFIEYPEKHIQKIHDVNYELFKNCLTPETLDELGAVYE
ncbi:MULTISPECIES: TIGR04255 family protein [Klebsiella]|uniref:TIGR04255 family protein n=1 Tax=Klebsiella TaxID=570 RepID=UPI001ABF09BB|nr:TIGR04255 family protein [Klebsiella quasipneumoniae]HED4103678.1 TIGR04255 family protein [Klebsiella aerogenes]